jgi:hypothetical protein
VKLDIELNRDHITISLLNKHRHLVIDYIGLTSLVIAVHKLRVLLPYQLWHESFYAIAKDLLFRPAEEHAKTIVDLDYLPKCFPISINDDEISQV